ncbi:hypothetical protein F5141DRAFT_1005237, partial [Pisolithus sp. B1]
LFSHGSPNHATVIPAMDHINKQFTTYSLDPTYSLLIHAGLELAKKTLNCYYAHMDQSRSYHVAVVLHPRHKLSYFQQGKWPEHWIRMAETIVHDTASISQFFG